MIRMTTVVYRRFTPCTIASKGKKEAIVVSFINEKSGINRLVPYSKPIGSARPKIRQSDGRL